MLQAMNTGHDGSLTTVHANSPRDALARLDTMVAMSNLNIPTLAVRRQIASAISVVIQVSRLSDGTRKVTSISEITGMEGDVITMQEIFSFKKRGISRIGRSTRRVHSDWRAAEIRGATGSHRSHIAGNHVSECKIGENETNRGDSSGSNVRRTVFSVRPC